MVASLRSQSSLEISLLHWAHRRLLQPLAAPPLSPSLDFRFACFPPLAAAKLRPHWAYFALFRSTIRNSRLATLPLAILLCSLDFRFACFRHWRRRRLRPIMGALVLPSVRHSRLPSLMSSLGILLASLGLLRAVSFTIRNSRLATLPLAILLPLSSAWSPLCVRKAREILPLLHWAHRQLLQPLAAPPLFVLIDFRFRCFATGGGEARPTGRALRAPCG